MWPGHEGYGDGADDEDRRERGAAIATVPAGAILAGHDAIG
jgi:hypothetical protein